MRRFALSSLATVIGGASLVAAPVPAARADVTPVAAATALDLPAGVSASVSGSGSVETQAFNDFPSKGAQYVVLSTGEADDVMLASPLAIDDPRTVANERDPDPVPMSTDRGNDGTPDTTTLSLTVDPSVGAGCLYIDFAMATDETVREFEVGTPADRISITRAADTSTQYAKNVGRGYFAQAGWSAEPRDYTSNDIDYWHQPGALADVLDGQLESPRLSRWTRLDNVTTKDTARVPLDFSQGADVINVDVSDRDDAPGRPGDAGETDSAAFVDNVRVASCSAGNAAAPSQQYGDGSIKGDRRVGYPLSYDPFPSTPAIERYDAADNGWAHPAPAAPTDLRFRWYRTKYTCSGPYNSDMNNWVPIPDGDRQSYVPTNLDRGHCLIVLVSGVVDGRPTGTFPNTDEAGTNPQKWYVTLPIDYGVFQDGSTPTIVHDGTPKVGEELSALPVPTRPLQESWSYQWYADNTLISGATASTLVLAAAQRGKAITVRAAASRSGFDLRSWTSAATPLVAGDQMESVGSPTIAPQGDGQPPVVGDVLVADAGPGWPAGTAYAHQWRRNGVNITSAQSPTYTTTAADAGTLITVVVTGSKPGFDPVSATSPAVSVSGMTMAGATPVITGTATVGSKLTGSADGWLPTLSNLTYTWYAGGTVLQTGVSRTYVVTAAAAGQSIVLRVTGSKTGYTPLSVDSAPTAVVPAPSLSSGTVRIIGLAKVRATLRASVSGWGPAPVTVSYRWKIGSKFVTGAKGTQSFLKLKKSARGKKVTVIVTITKPGYTSVQRVVTSKKVKR